MDIDPKLMREVFDFAARHLGIEPAAALPRAIIKDQIFLRYLLDRNTNRVAASRIGALFVPPPVRDRHKLNWDIGFEPAFNGSDIYDRARAAHEATHYYQWATGRWNELGHEGRESEAEAVQAAYANWYEQQVLLAKKPQTALVAASGTVPVPAHKPTVDRR